MWEEHITYKTKVNFKKRDLIYYSHSETGYIGEDRTMSKQGRSMRWKRSKTQLKYQGAKIQLGSSVITVLVCTQATKVGQSNRHKKSALHWWWVLWRIKIMLYAYLLTSWHVVGLPSISFANCLSSVHQSVNKCNYGSGGDGACVYMGGKV